MKCCRYCWILKIHKVLGDSVLQSYGGGLGKATAHELTCGCYLQPVVVQKLLKCINSCANKPNLSGNICHISSCLLLLLQILA